MKFRLTAASLMLAAAAAIAPQMSAQLTAAKVFADAPQSLFPLIDRNTRLDMIDYFNSGMETPSANNLGGKSRITAMTPQSIDIEMTDASTYGIALLPAGSDTLVAVINTVATPAPDSRLSIYSRDCQTNLTSRTFKRPGLADWLTDEGRKNSSEVEALVPFLLISYAYDPATSTLTMTNNTGQFLSADVYELVEDYLLPSLTYRWNGKKFERR